MAQHYLLSSAAKSLSLATVARMSEEEAWEAFRRIRWAYTEGQPVCPRCGCLDSYTYKTRKVFRCKGCSHQFTVTSGSLFASRKMPMRDYLLAIAIFVNGAKGHSALQLSRDLSCNYKSAYVLTFQAAAPSPPLPATICQCPAGCAWPKHRPKLFLLPAELLFIRHKPGRPALDIGSIFG